MGHMDIVEAMYESYLSLKMIIICGSSQVIYGGVIFAEIYRHRRSFIHKCREDIIKYFARIKPAENCSRGIDDVLFKIW